MQLLVTNGTSARTFASLPVMGAAAPVRVAPMLPAPNPVAPTAPTAPAIPRQTPPISPISGVPVQISIFQPATATSELLTADTEYQQPLGTFTNPPAVVTGAATPAPPAASGLIFGLNPESFWIILLLAVALILVMGL